MGGTDLDLSWELGVEIWMPADVSHVSLRTIPTENTLGSWNFHLNLGLEPTESNQKDVFSISV